jgi:uncharacterized protein (TIGR03435 family)
MITGTNSTSKSRSSGNAFSNRKLGIAVALLAMTALLPRHDLTAQELQFEVASVKQDDPNARGQVTNHTPEIAGDRVQARSSDVLILILYAYNLKPFQVTGNRRLPNPPNLFDVDAKVEGTHSEDDVRLMFQSLLRDRFKLRTHWETHTLDGYRLTMAKGGAKLKAASPHGIATFQYKSLKVREGDVFLLVGADGGHVMSNAAPISKLTSMLTHLLQSPILDETSLTGTYDYAFDFTPDYVSPDIATDSPTLATALKKETGLTLEKAKIPVKILVVDHIEKPTPN